MFYGWKIGLLSMSGNFMLQSCALYVMNAFMEPLCEVNGWSRDAINAGMGNCRSGLADSHAGDGRAFCPLPAAGVDGSRRAGGRLRHIFFGLQS